MKADFHLHTNYSDGKLSVESLMNKLIRNNITIFAKTDHNTVAGNAEIEKLAVENQITFINGLEMSSYPTVESDKYDNTYSLHIVGLGVNSEIIQPYLDIISEQRQQNLKSLITELQTNNYDISVNDATNVHGFIVDRGAIASALCSKGYFSDNLTAFKELLNTDKYIKYANFGFDIKETIRIIHEANGVAIWAHPYEFARGTKITISEDDISDILKKMVEYSLDGIESYYFKYDEAQTAFLHKLALKYNLLESCGSDYHGRNEVQYNIFLQKDKVYNVNTLIERLML